KVNLPFYTTGYSFPFVFRDGGQTKILAGAERGTLMLYDHIDGNLGGAFTLVDSVYMNINQGTRTAPTGADINNDGFIDLVVGNYQGGVSFYKGTGSIITVEDMYENITWNFDLYPNPSNSNFTIRLYDFKRDHYQLQLYNVVGQTILTEQITSNLSNINTELIPNGIYFCKIIDTSNNTSLVKRVVIQH
ncbi:MAG: T9SS type A sorting domain-containing protein, partial [Bacteroidia bacterium]|nr:T9SS type A sorting domain-containing protein [Bacteroidia bacterium]